MTRDDFQRTYHDYQTNDRAEALRDAAEANQQAEGFTVVVVDFEDLGYALMLSTAAEFLGLKIVREAGDGQSVHHDR